MDEPVKLGDLPTLMEDRSDEYVPRILLVGDEKFLSDYLKREFSRKGYEIDDVLTIEDAETKIQQFLYRLIFCDLSVNGQPSTGFIRLCKEACLLSKVIAIAGGNEISQSVDALKAGAFDVIAKPMNFGKLKSIIEDSFSLDKDNITAISLEPPAGYRIIREVSAGGLCTVLLAEKDGSYYAIKILSNNLYSAEKLKRFFREAGIMLRIGHPNIVRIFEYGFSESSQIPYIVMEYVVGKTLAKAIQEGPISSELGLKILRQICSALETVHGHGILHRDIKPRNVILNREMEVKLTDFGVAHTADSNLTMTNAMLGSPAYMAPECFDSSKEADQRSDIFSLGVLSYEMFTGVLPFGGKTIAQVKDSVKNKLAVKPRSIDAKIPLGIQSILAKMLQKSPDSRYQSASEIIRAVEDFEKNKYFHKEKISDRLKSALGIKRNWR